MLDSDAPQITFAPVRVTIYDVLGSLVHALGGCKKVGSILRKDRDPDAAQKWCANCLDPNRRDQFRPDDIERLFQLGHEAGYHEGMQAFARLCGYEPPQPMTAEQQRDYLLREIHRKQLELDAAQRELAGLIHRLGALEAGKR